MIEEPGRVVALDKGAVWVETRRKSTCSGCSAKNGCGQGLMDTLGLREKRGLVRALTDIQLQVGDSVIVGIREDVLLRGAVLVYLFPLIMLMITAVVAAQFSSHEPVIIFSGCGGFFASWLLVRMRTRRTASNPDWQPVILRAMLAGPASP